jgi:hypothetical protein
MPAIMVLAAAFAALLAVAPVGDPCAPGAAREQLAAEIGALRRGLEGVVPAKGTEAEWKQGLSLLEEADAALGKGRAYLALDRLAAARLLLGPLRFLSQNGAKPKEAVAALRADLAAMASELARPSSPLLPLAVRAFRDEARVQAPVYGDTIGAWDGIQDAMGAMFYGGQGVELARIAAFDAGLRFPLPPQDPKLSVTAVTDAVDAYELDLVAAYKPPVSADKHQQFILASAALKTAREVAAAGSAEGALWNYLKARRYGAPITRADAPAPALDALRATPPVHDQGDASLVCRLTQQVEGLLEGTEVPEDRLRLADSLLHDVLPEYRRLAAAKTPARKPVPAVAGAAEVTVTLVRWPYT